MQYKTPIRILECIRQGQIGGGESHLLSLVENLNKSEFKPLVLSFTEGPMIDRLNKMGIETQVIHTESPFDFRKIQRIKDFIREKNVALVHAHGTRAMSNIIWPSSLLKLPVVYTVHGWSFHDDQNFLTKKLREMGEKYLTRKASVNISVSQSNKESGERRIPGFSSIVVNNGIDMEKFDPTRTFSDFRGEMQIPKDAIIALFLARFTHQKQPIALLRSFLAIAPKNPTLYLVMVGEGEQKEEAVQMVEKSEFKDRIKLLPFRQDVPDVLASSDIFVLPSLWEGLPIGLLEAMAMGKAIIATRVDGTKEVIKENENGLFVDVENLQESLSSKLQVLSQDIILRQKIGNQAIETIKDGFNAKKMTQEIESVYYKVLEN